MPYRPTPRTEARRQAVRARVLDEAVTLVAGGGYTALSVAAVADAAQVAVGTVYRHFPSKAALAAEVFSTAADPELAVVAESTADDGRSAADRCAAAAEAFCRRALAAPTLAHAQLAEPVGPEVERERLRLRRGYRDVFAGVLADGVRSGELAPHDTETVASALVGALGEALVGPLAAGRRGDELVDTLTAFCLRSLPIPSSRGGGPSSSGRAPDEPINRSATLA